MQRLDADELVDAVLLEPGEELPRRAVIGGARVFVADPGGEEFEEAARCLIAGGGDEQDLLP